MLELHEHRLAIVRTEKSFVKAVGVVRRMNRNLLSQPRETLEEMGGTRQSDGDGVSRSPGGDAAGHG
ncbi:MAG: hypothetical protein IPP88_17160 [Betaproteobacteria bacterium]|nr:hypothetical protein [Betaproteobacteria bacterium]